MRPILPQGQNSIVPRKETKERWDLNVVVSSKFDQLDHF